MRLYHGTASTYLPSIEKVGLVPTTPDRVFDIEVDSGAGNPYTEHAVYLTTDLNVAKMFAELRAAYLRATPGAHISEAYGGMFWKAPTAPKPVSDANPIVLALDVPENIAAKLHRDDASPDQYQAFWYPGIIPATAIKDILTPA